MISATIVHPVAEGAGWLRFLSVACPAFRFAGL